MVPVELEFREGGNILVGTFSCAGDSRLESGNRGWFAVSKHIDWRCGWCLKVQCSITEARQYTGFKRPPNAKRELMFEPAYYGSLLVDDRRLTVFFRVPDCLDPPEKKSFNWKEDIVLGERAFDCRLRLEIRAPKDGTYLRRMAATPTRLGGIEFVSPGLNGAVVMGRIQDSETGRGRQDRIEAFITERSSEYLVGEPYTGVEGHTRQDFDLSAHQKLLEQAREFVDHHLNSHDDSQ